MLSHLTDTAVLIGVAMVVAGGLLHAAMLSLFAGAHPAIPAEHRSA